MRTTQTSTARGNAALVKNSQTARRGGGRPVTIEAADPCATCGKPGAKLPARKWCAACVAQLHAEATAQQERDYLHRWLYGRRDADASDPEWRTITRLRAAAKALGMDWRTPAPPPLTYDQRMAVLTNRPPRKPPMKRTTAKRKKGSGAA